jgi:DNA repair protein RecO (recombination protein O)
MKFTDDGIIISSKKHGENSLIIKILSKNHGICNIYVKNAINYRSYAKYHIGNLVFFDCYAKNDNVLAYAKIENLKSFSAKHILEFNKLQIITYFSLIISQNFMDLDPNQDLFDDFLEFLQNLDQDNRDILANIIKLELKLLEIFGYGLDLSHCAVTSSDRDLYFISPKSGKAVSKKAAEGYENKLFKFTNFFRNKLILNDEVSKDDLMQSLDISKFFMQKYNLLKSESGKIRMLVVK